jgi:hypothetical protein
MRILRGIGSRTLPCGCLVGLYETYDRQTVAIIDARCSTCADPNHVVDAIITIEFTGTNTLQALKTTV